MSEVGERHGARGGHGFRIGKNIFVSFPPFARFQSGHFGCLHQCFLCETPQRSISRFILFSFVWCNGDRAVAREGENLVDILRVTKSIEKFSEAFDTFRTNFFVKGQFQKLKIKIKEVK